MTAWISILDAPVWNSARVNYLSSVLASVVGQAKHNPGTWIQLGIIKTTAVNGRLACDWSAHKVYELPKTGTVHVNIQPKLKQLKAPSVLVIAGT